MEECIGTQGRSPELRALRAGIKRSESDGVPATKPSDNIGDGLEYWPMFSESGETVMHFKDGCSLMGIPNKPQIDVIDQYYLYKQEKKN